MREWVLLSPTGVVIDIAMTTVVTGPHIVPEQHEGAHWIPIEEVPEYRLEHYQYWSVRP